MTASTVPADPTVPATATATATATPTRSNSHETEGKGSSKEVVSSPPISRTPSMLHDLITAENATIPLAWMSLLTGLVDGAVYAHFQVWVGFQTGNIVQFSMNIAEFIYPWSPQSYPLLTLMRALSFTSFFLASFLGARVGKKCGEKKRWYLMVSSILQGLILFGASGILFSRPNGEEPTFQYAPAVIVLVAFSMVSERAGTQFKVSHVVSLR